MPGPGFELRTSRSIISALMFFQPQGAQIEEFEGGEGMGRKRVKCDLKAAIGTCEVPEHAVCEVPEHAICEVPVHAVQFCCLGSTTFP